MTTTATARSVQRPADLLLAAAFAGVTQAEVWVFSLGSDHPIGLRVVVSALTLVASAALAWRRTRPVAAFWVNSAAVVALAAAGYPSDVYQWTNLVVTYSIAAHGTSRQAWAALPALVGGVVFYFVRFPDEGNPTLAATVVAMWVVAWLIGRMYGARLEQAQLRPSATWPGGWPRPTRSGSPSRRSGAGSPTSSTTSSATRST